VSVPLGPGSCILQAVDCSGRSVCECASGARGGGSYRLARLESLDSAEGRRPVKVFLARDLRTQRMNQSWFTRSTQAVRKIKRKSSSLRRVGVLARFLHTQQGTKAGSQEHALQALSMEKKKK